MGSDSDLLTDRLAGGPPVVLDGPMGTELNRRGVDTGLPLWSAWALLHAPDVVREIHGDYLSAGAELLTTNTFRTHARSLASAGLGARAAELTALAVRLAREAIRAATGQAGSSCLLAGSVSPLEDCYSPELTPAAEMLGIEHAEMVRHLEAAGVDLYLVETMPTIREAVAAAGAAAATGKPVLVALTCNDDGDLVSGESVAAAAAALEALAPAAMLINCTPTSTLHRALRRLAAATARPIGAYGNVGHAEDDQGWAATGVLGPDEYAAEVGRWLGLGARLVGGCCGTTPQHLRAVTARLAAA